MSLIVEDGSFRADAESYLSVADADTYNLKHSANVAWIAAVTADKERALRRATQYLDLQYLTDYVGERTTNTQALAWPRVDVVDPDGYQYNVNVLPVPLLNATAEAALRFLVDGDLVVDVEADSSGIKSESVTVGPISTSTTYMTEKMEQKKYPIIELSLTWLIGSEGEVSRG